MSSTHPAKRHHVIIYPSKSHIFVTIGLIALPFFFLLIFSRIAKIATGRLFLDLAMSCGRLAISYVVAAILAWICAVAFYRGRRSVVALPIFDVLQSFPSFAILPLMTMFWGPSEKTVIFLLTLSIIWPIFFSVLSSLKLARRDWEEAAEIAGWKGFEYLKRFVLPVSAPGLITGSIVGLGEGWEALVATEIIVHTPVGLGSFFSTFSQNTSITMLGVLGLLLLIFIINKLIWLPLLEQSHHLTED